MRPKAVGGGERGIRTPEGLLTLTRFPGVRLKPLIHLSGTANYSNSPTLGLAATDSDVAQFRISNLFDELLHLG